jgi:hypothetical protein
LVGFTTAGLFYGAAVMFNGIALFNDPSSTTAEFNQWMTQAEGVDGWYSLGIISSAIAFWAWLTRAITNTPVLGGGTPEFSPRAAVGWWFVPIANLVQGYRMVADLWRRMAVSPDAQGTGQVLAWWLLWIGGTLVSRGATAASPTDLAGVTTLFQVASGAYVALGISGVLLCRIVWVIQHRADSRAQALLTAPASVPTVQSPVIADAPVPARGFCPGCGTAREADARFCAGCGRELA